MQVDRDIKVLIKLVLHEKRRASFANTNYTLPLASRCTVYNMNAYDVFIEVLS